MNTKFIVYKEVFNGNTISWTSFFKEKIYQVFILKTKKFNKQKDNKSWKYVENNEKIIFTSVFMWIWWSNIVKMHLELKYKISGFKVVVSHIVISTDQFVFYDVNFKCKNIMNINDFHQNCGIFSVLCSE